MENRYPNKFKFSGLKTFPSDVDSWFMDNYGLRTQLIRNDNRIMRHILKQNDIRCIVGNSGYLFLGNRYENILDGYNKHYTEKEINDGTKFFTDRRNNFEKQGAKYYVVIAPNKLSIYSEHSPKNLIRTNSGTIYDNFQNKFYANHIKTVNLKQLFLTKYKQYHEKLYHKTDTHWSSLGGYFGYYETMLMLKKDFKQLKLAPMPTFKSVKQPQGYDLVRICGLSGTKQNDFNMYYDLNINLKDITNGFPGKNVSVNTSSGENMLGTSASAYYNPKALNKMTVLINRDSFAINMFPFLEETFSKVIYVHWYVTCDKNYGTDAMMKKYHPDIVIDEKVERMLNLLAK